MNNNPLGAVDPNGGDGQGKGGDKAITVFLDYGVNELGSKRFIRLFNHSILIQRTTSSGANERYVIDGHEVLIDLNAGWSVATTYLSELGTDNHLRQTSAATGISFFLTDHLGSTSALTDVGGNMVEGISSDSFGNSAGSTRTRYGYTGRERDSVTGLLLRHSGARDRRFKQVTFFSLNQLQVPRFGHLPKRPP